MDTNNKIEQNLGNLVQVRDVNGDINFYAAPSQQPRRFPRWLRFGLLTLTLIALVFTALVCVFPGRTMSSITAGPPIGKQPVVGPAISVTTDTSAPLPTSGTARQTKPHTTGATSQPTQTEAIASVPAVTTTVTHGAPTASQPVTTTTTSPTRSATTSTAHWIDGN